MDLHTDNEDRLLTVAASISDRSGVDWNDVNRTCESADDAAILAQLRILDGIAQVHAERSAWGSLTIIAPVGHGAFGTVYRAFDLELQREVALKVTKPQELPSGFDAERLVREARLLAQVRHPNVVLLFGAERKGDEIGVAMEFINGQTLDDLVTSHGPFSAREAAVIGIDLCRALAAVHGAGLLHGDIKAHNVMREAGGRIVLMDFGASRKLDVGIRASGNDFAGTPLYAAPEMFAGEPRSIASDIYSLGVLLYFLATGRYPVEGDTRTQITISHELGTARRRLRDVRPDLPDDFVRVVERATGELPAARYQSAGEFEGALAATIAAPVGTSMSPRRTRTWVVAAAGCVLAAGLAGAAGYDRLNRTQPVAPADITRQEAARPAPVIAPDSYSVQAAMYRADDTGPVKLASGARLKPGDRLYLQVKTSKPAHVYVVNEDDRGESYLLFPLPGREGTLALPADRQNRIPSIEGGQEADWQVTSTGGHEHFVIFVSPDPLTTFEKVFAALPRASADRQVSSVRLPEQSLGLLRGVGGVAVRPVKPGSVPSIAAQYDTPLPPGPETTQGTWIRQVTFANP